MATTDSKMKTELSTPLEIQLRARKGRILWTTEAEIQGEPISAENKVDMERLYQYFFYYEWLKTDLSQLPRYDHEEDKIIWKMFDSTGLLQQLPPDSQYSIIIKGLIDEDEDNDTTWVIKTGGDYLLEHLKRMISDEKTQILIKKNAQINVFIISSAPKQYQCLTANSALQARFKESDFTYAGDPRLALFENINRLNQFIKQLEASQKAEKELTGKTWAEWWDAWRMGSLEDELDVTVARAREEIAKKKFSKSIAESSPRPHELKEKLDKIENALNKQTPLSSESSQELLIAQFSKTFLKRNITEPSKVYNLLKSCIAKKDGFVIPSPELALRRAAAEGKIDTVKDLIAYVKDLDIEQTGDSGFTALMYAEKYGKKDIVEFLEKIRKTKSCDEKP